MSIAVLWSLKYYLHCSLYTRGRDWIEVALALMLETSHGRRLPKGRSVRSTLCACTHGRRPTEDLDALGEARQIGYPTLPSGNPRVSTGNWSLVQAVVINPLLSFFLFYFFFSSRFVPFCNFLPFPWSGRTAEQSGWRAGCKAGCKAWCPPASPQWPAWGSQTTP